MIKAVLFDLDGTLIDTNELVYRGFNYIFNEKLNLNYDKKKIGENYGRPLEVSFSKVSQNDEEMLELIKEYRSFVLEIHDDLCTAFIGAKELLEYLKKKNILIGIVTSKKGDVATRGLKVTGLLEYIDVLVSPECTNEHKPSGQPIEYALEKLGILKEEAMMVGDSPYDILSGKNARVKTCGVSYTEVDVESLKETKPDYYIEHLKEIENIIESLEG
ncbi:MAG: pyrophosphatase PpaX [Clostridium sp.]|uniref:pyrophosphatase PpaX n=1 Tax=Clostridium sp. TaxID=1506 RepID=UPI003F3A421A